jgi:hypothetical protein
MFKDGLTNIHNEEQSGRPSVVSGALAQSEIWLITISELSCECPQISCTVVYEIITVRLGYHKLCARWIPKVLTGVYKMQRMALT